MKHEPVDAIGSRENEVGIGVDENRESGSSNGNAVGRGRRSHSVRGCHEEATSDDLV